MVNMSGNSRTSTKYCSFPKEGWFTPVILQVSRHLVRDQHGLVVKSLIFMNAVGEVREIGKNGGVAG